MRDNELGRFKRTNWLMRSIMRKLSILYCFGHLNRFSKYQVQPIYFQHFLFVSAIANFINFMSFIWICCHDKAWWFNFNSMRYVVKKYGISMLDKFWIQFNINDTHEMKWISMVLFFIRSIERKKCIALCGFFDAIRSKYAYWERWPMDSFIRTKQASANKCLIVTDRFLFIIHIMRPKWTIAANHIFFIHFVVTHTYTKQTHKGNEKHH